GGRGGHNTPEGPPRVGRRGISRPPFWDPTAAARPAGSTASAVTADLTLTLCSTAKDAPFSTDTSPESEPATSREPSDDSATAWTSSGIIADVPKPRRPVRSLDATVPPFATGQKVQSSAANTASNTEPRLAVTSAATRPLATFQTMAWPSPPADSRRLPDAENSSELGAFDKPASSLISLPVEVFQSRMT